MKTRRKSTVVAVCIVLIVLGAGTAALAAANPETTSPALAARIERWRNQVEDRAAAAWRRIRAGVELHPELAPKWEAILGLREANTSLAEANAGLRTQLATELKALRDAGAVLPEEVRAGLKEYRQEAGRLHESLRATAGQLRAVLADAVKRQVLRTLNEPQLDALLDDITAVLTTRNSCLQGLNDAFAASLALLP